VTRAWLVVVALAGCYSPPEPDCGFVCGPGDACPADYTCASDHHCHRNGAPAALTCAPGDAAGASAPRVVSVDPPNGAQDVAVDTIPEAIVDQDVIGVSNTTFQLFQDSNLIAGVADYAPQSHAVRFLAQRNLDEFGFFRVVLAEGITNAAGEPLPPMQWTFITGADTAPPRVYSTDPVALQTGVSTSTNIMVVFTEGVTGVDATTFRVDAGGPVTGSVSEFDAGTYTFAPAALLPSNTTITVTLGTGIQDEKGNPFAGYGFSFTTQ
jgi:hypothetical protein